MKHLSPLSALALAALFVITAPSEAATRKKAPAKQPAAEAVLPEANPEQLAAAERVSYGNYACEFKQAIVIDRDAKNPGYVKLNFKNKGWTMKPVVSTTGAVRMEDVRGEALMLQIANKSMLLNPKSGQRMVDDCQTQGQQASAQAVMN